LLYYFQESTAPGFVEDISPAKSGRHELLWVTFVIKAQETQIMETLGNL